MSHKDPQYTYKFEQPNAINIHSYGLDKFKFLAQKSLGFVEEILQNSNTNPSGTTLANCKITYDSLKKDQIKPNFNRLKKELNTEAKDNPDLIKTLISIKCDVDPIKAMEQLLAIFKNINGNENKNSGAMKFQEALESFVNGETTLKKFLSNPKSLDKLDKLQKVYETKIEGKSHKLKYVIADVVADVATNIRQQLVSLGTGTEIRLPFSTRDITPRVIEISDTVTSTGTTAPIPPKRADVTGTASKSILPPQDSDSRKQLFNKIVGKELNNERQIEVKAGANAGYYQFSNIGSTSKEYDHTNRLIPPETVNPINMTRIKMNGGTYVAAQAPVERSIGEFFNAAFAGSGIILNLVRTGGEGCHDYWSESGAPEKKAHDGSWRVADLPGDLKVHREATSIPLKLGDKIIGSQYTFTIRDSQGEIVPQYENKKLTMFNYTAWPDHGVPDNPQEVIQLAKLVNERKEQLPKEQKEAELFVHCKAGVGRTGTVVSLIDEISALKATKQTEQDPVERAENLVVNLRKYRNQMVQTPDQFELLCSAIKQIQGEATKDIKTFAKSAITLESPASKQLSSVINTINNLYNAPIAKSNLLQKNDYGHTIPDKDKVSKYFESLPLGSVLILPLSEKEVSFAIKGKSGVAYFHLEQKDSIWMLSGVTQKEPSPTTLENFYEKINKFIIERKSIVAGRKLP